MKQIGGIVLLFFLALQVYADDWRRLAADCLTGIHDYERLTNLLEKATDTLSLSDQRAVRLLLGYSYHELRDRLNEGRCLRFFFENEGGEDPSYAFLPPRARMMVLEYLEHWRKKYPKLIHVDIPQSHRRICFFSPPEQFLLEVEIRAPADVTVLGPSGEILFTKAMPAGRSNLKFPFTDLWKRDEAIHLYFTLQSDEVEVKRVLIIEPGFQVPKNVLFNPANGAISLPDKAFMEENYDVEEWRQRRVFSRQDFIKKGLIPFLIGAVALAVDLAVLQPAIKDPGVSRTARVVGYGMGGTAGVMALGFSLKGILGMIRSWKVEKEKYKRTVVDPQAVENNRRIQLELESIRREIFVEYSWHLGTGD